MTQQFGKYLLLKRLAVGGMAEIWLAKQLGLQGFEKLVVVKRILDQHATERDFVQMFLDEARLAASLNHPHVVQIYDLGQEQASFYIAMEFIAGHDLLAILRKCKHAQAPLPPPIAARLIAGACEGLHYAHTRKDNAGNPLNIVHRDVSPSNILVTYEGGVKVVDFGIAKAETQSTKTEGGKIKGKFSYMSPEQIRSVALDARSDVFALGIVLYEILVGRRLFKRENELAIMQDILEGEIRRASELRADVPPALDEILEKALQKDRRRRFASAQEMQLALEKYLASTAEPPTSVHVSQFMLKLFAEEHTAYQALLRELPTARPEQLVHIIEQGHRTGTGNSQVSGFTDPGAEKVDGEHRTAVLDAVKRPSERKKVGTLAALAVAGVAALAGVGFVLTRPSAPPLPVEGELTVESDPPGAALVVDGIASKVTTPGTLRMLGFDQDIHVRVEKEGREPREVTVRLTRQAASKTISVMLPPEQAKPGAISLETEPPGASVVLDGKQLEGTTPLTLPEVASGVEHLIRISLAGHQDEAATVKVEPGATAPVKLALKALPPPEPEPTAEAISDPRGKKGKKELLTGEVEISSTPPADIFLGSKKLGHTPATVKLPVGKVALTFVNAELELRQTTSVNVDAKGKSRAAVEFRKGKIAADARPWADVYIGERKLGTTPLAPREVYEGSYTVRLVNSELGAIKAVKVVVEPGRTTVVREQLQ
ncbi:serine/threonine-protein kinase [Hyalangium versicolor]|uniref:serine/threonine-protein kinase n=1 Tax=Hyalangium versicolor TaxID=2861190 RepID=UPI001CCEA3F6|nr:serine/threonine-protein kinase [Hyalangium versicolor]